MEKIVFFFIILAFWCKESLINFLQTSSRERDRETERERQRERKKEKEREKESGTNMIYFMSRRLELYGLIYSFEGSPLTRVLLIIRR